MTQNRPGPRHSGGYRPNNQAALDAAEQVLSGAKQRKIERMRLARFRVDTEQPRDYIPAQAIEDRAKSLEHETQLDPIKARPLTEAEMKARTADEVRNGVDHQLIDGEVRFWGLLKNAQEWAYFEIFRDLPKDENAMREKVLDIQNAQNIEHFDMSLSAYCRAIYRYKTEFGRTFKFLADNQYRKYAKGSQDWVAERYRLWNKIRPEQTFESQAEAEVAADCVKLAQRYSDVLTHLQIIVSQSDLSLRRRMITATVGGASAVDLRKMIPVAIPAPAPPLTPPRPPRVYAPSNASDPPVTAEDLEALSDADEEPSQDELNEQAAQLDWGFNDEPEYDAATFSGHLHTVNRLLDMAVHQAPAALKHRHVNETALDAFETSLRITCEKALLLLDAVKAGRAKENPSA